MIHYTCDMCGRGVRPDEMRFEVKVDIHMAQDPLDCCDDDDDCDHLEQLTEMIEQIEASGEEDLNVDGSQQLRFDLCCNCQKKFLKNPLGKETFAQQLNFSQN